MSIEEIRAELASASNRDAVHLGRRSAATQAAIELLHMYDAQAKELAEKKEACLRCKP